jgi:hypothetical protein
MYMNYICKYSTANTDIISSLNLLLTVLPGLQQDSSDRGSNPGRKNKFLEVKSQDTQVKTQLVLWIFILFKVTR